MVDITGVGILLLSCTIGTVFCLDSVPVFIWGDKLSQKQYPDVLAGHTLSKQDFYQQYLQHIAQSTKHNVAVFFQDKLNLEDITNHGDVYKQNSDGGAFHHLKSLLESHTSTQLPSVDSAAASLKHLTEKFGGKVHELRDHHNLNKLPLDKDGGNLIMVHLPKTGVSQGMLHKSLKNIDGILGSVTSQLKSLHTPFTALYTAHHASKVPEEHLYTGRHLLADEQTNATFINTTDLLFYAKVIKLQITQNGQISSYTLPPVTSKHIEVNNDNSSVRADFNYKGTTLPTGLSSIAYSMMFTIQKSRWTLAHFTLSYKSLNGSEDDKTTNVSKVWAPIGFSYHCTNLPPIKEANGSAQVVFTDFQVQAGKIKNAKFGTANDCVGFFTIPIWSGLFGSLVLTLILVLGIAMIMNITTMDRFDDPKGKTITVNVAE